MKIALYSVSSILVLAFSYLVFRYFVRKDYHEKGRTSWFSILLEILVFLFHAHLSYFFIPARWPYLPNFPTNSAVQIIALFLIGIGIIITLTAMISLGYRRTFGQGSDKINISGFYRYSRNPQIVAYGLVIVGFVMLWPSWYSLVWIISYGILAHLMVITEEEFLQRTHGVHFDKYRSQVSRYITINRSKDRISNNR